MTRARSVGYVVEHAYLRALRERVEAGPGVTAIARQAGVSRVTVWKMLNPGEGPMRVVTIDAVLRIREALHALEPDGARLPPPVVGVRDGAHHAWIQLAERFEAAELAAIVAEPAQVETALRAIASGKKPRGR